MTVANIINGLSMNDAGLDFWEKIHDLINHGQYAYVFDLLQNHKHDYDYNTQVAAVCNSILQKVQPK